jgi:hypothetical protein
VVDPQLLLQPLLPPGAVYWLLPDKRPSSIVAQLLRRNRSWAAWPGRGGSRRDDDGLTAGPPGESTAAEAGQGPEAVMNMAGPLLGQLAEDLRGSCLLQGEQGDAEGGCGSNG